MSVRPHPTIEGVWIIDYLPNGKRPDPVTGKVRRERIKFRGSEAAARAAEAELRKQPLAPVIGSSIIEKVFPHRLEWYQNNKSSETAKDFAKCWNILAKITIDDFSTITIGKLKFSQLTLRIEERIKKVRTLQGVKKRTIHKELTYLRSMWKWAAKNGYCEKPHFDIVGYDNKSTAPPPLDVPRPEEIQAIIDNAHPDRRLLVMIYYYCGCRRTEACTVRRRGVWLDRGLIQVTGKGNKTRLVPIPDLPEFIDALRQAMQHFNGTEYLIINPMTKRPYKDIRDTIKQAAVRAGIALKVNPDKKHITLNRKLSAHVLRHGYCTHGIEAGIHPKTIQENAGHVSFQTTEGYVHLVAEHRTGETTKLADYLKTVAPSGKKWEPRYKKKK